jgi:glyoxylase-like metal-dependent hydrolase (beta-lactamase superfamily II)
MSKPSLVVPASFAAALVASGALIACTSESTPAPTPPSSTAPLTVQPFVAGEPGFLVTSTLIAGASDAVLVDGQFLESEAARLVETIRASGRRLTAVYVTHAHPDHYFGLPVIKAAFPEARILAHPTVAAQMKARWQAKHDQWKPVFGDDIADTAVDAEPYDDDTLTLEGQEIQLLGPAAGDDADLVTLYVPSARALIASDTAYSGVHAWLAESKADGGAAWLATLDRLRALEPAVVIAGHDDPARPDDATSLAATAAYIRDFQAAVAASTTPEQVVAAMTAKYPTLALPVILDIAAKANLAK